MKYRSIFIAAALLLVPLLAGAAERLIIDHVTVIEGTGRAPQPDMAVIIDGAQIAAVTASQLAGSEPGRRIDARNKYLIPGLMDVHIHLRGAAQPSGPGVKWETASRDEALAALASYLYSGVTTVFDAGNLPKLILPLRADERAGRILAPRIFATGNAITYPGSHGDRISLGIADFEKDKALLDAHIAEQQPDLLKLMIEEEGWGSRPMITLLTADLAEKIVRYYNQHGIRTTAHVSNEFRALEAIYAGLDTLAHPVIQGPVSDSFVKLMAAKKMPFASTLTIGENYSRLAEHPEYLDQPLYAASLSVAERNKLKTETAAEYRARTWTTWMKINDADRAGEHPQDPCGGRHRCLRHRPEQRACRASRAGTAGRRRHRAARRHSDRDLQQRGVPRQSRSARVGAGRPARRPGIARCRSGRQHRQRQSDRVRHEERRNHR
jgi:imidazolonepropionase-like amidohydrolase